MKTLLRLSTPSFFGHGRPLISARDPTAAGADDTFNPHEDQVEEQGRGEDAEVDDDPAHDRDVYVIGLTPVERDELSDKAWARRQWEVLSLRHCSSLLQNTIKCL